MSYSASPRHEHPEEAYPREAYPRQAAPAAAPKPKKASGPVPVEVVEAPPRAMGASPAPWWFAAPGIAVQAFHAFFLPFKLVVWACEIVVSLTFTAMVGSIGLWWIGWIPDEAVRGAITGLADRLQGILKGAGLM